MVEPDDREALAARAWGLFMGVGRQRLETVGHELDAMGLSRMMAQFLGEICESPPGPMNHLASRFGVDPAWVTGVVDRLEARGDIVRRPSSEDRRVKLLEVTEHGRRTCEAVRALFTQPPPQLLNASRSDLQALVRIAKRLADATPGAGVRVPGDRRPGARDRQAPEV